MRTLARGRFPILILVLVDLTVMVRKVRAASKFTFTNVLSQEELAFQELNLFKQLVTLRKTLPESTSSTESSSLRPSLDA